MSALVARCPHCDTAFRVVPDQLRVRQGRVRCGVCHEVFDGNAALAKAGLEPVMLRTSDPVAAAPVVMPVQPGSTDAGATPAYGGRTEPMLGTAPSPFVANGREPVLGGTARGAGSVVAPELADTLARKAEPTLGGGRTVWRDPAAAPLPVAPPPLRRPESVRVMVDPPEEVRSPATAVYSAPLASADEAPPRFAASRPDAPLPPMLAGQVRGGVSRLLFSLGFWLALLALVAQAAWWWRTPLATHIPVLRAPLESLCLSLGCEVGYVRAPQRLSIVSSSVQPAVLGGSATVQHLQLQAVLRNRAPHAQPWPSLEIILTDHADGVVARRVVSPEVYLPAGQARAPFPAGTDREIQLALAARGAPITGYRLALFYP